MNGRPNKLITNRQTRCLLQWTISTGPVIVWSPIKTFLSNKALSSPIRNQIIVLSLQLSLKSPFLQRTCVICYASYSVEGWKDLWFTCTAICIDPPQDKFFMDVSCIPHHQAFFLNSTSCPVQVGHVEIHLMMLTQFLLGNLILLSYNNDTFCSAS